MEILFGRSFSHIGRHFRGGHIPEHAV
jgi:hypothetical protein